MGCCPTYYNICSFDLGSNKKIKCYLMEITAWGISRLFEIRLDITENDTLIKRHAFALSMEQRQSIHQFIGPLAFECDEEMTEGF